MIERIEALIEKATPGQWYSSQTTIDGWAIADVGFQRVSTDHDEQPNTVGLADAAFIAHARQLLPLMLEVVRIAEFVAWEDEPIDSNHVLLSEYLGALDAYCAEHLPA